MCLPLVQFYSRSTALTYPTQFYHLNCCITLLIKTLIDLESLMSWDPFRTPLAFSGHLLGCRQYSQKSPIYS